jgi:hypothetical protein
MRLLPDETMAICKTVRAPPVPPPQKMHSLSHKRSLGLTQVIMAKEEL